MKFVLSSVVISLMVCASIVLYQSSSRFPLIEEKKHVDLILPEAEEEGVLQKLASIDGTLSSLQLQN